MNKVKVAVIIPCFNDGKYIDQAVDSILSQTFQDFEIIIVNDGSTDPLTIEKLVDYKKPKTRVLHKENGHLSSARNHGIKNADADYILPLDADDLFEPTYLEKAVKVLDEKPETGVVTCDIRLFENMEGVWRSKSGDLMSCIAKNDICGNSLFRFQCWLDAGGYNENMRGFEDWDFWVGVTKNGWKVYSIPEVLFNYRITDKSMYQNLINRGPELMRQIIENHKEVYEENFVEVIFQNQQQIYQLEEKLRLQEKVNKDKLNKIRKSTSYKIGSFLLSPLKLIFRILR